MAFEMKQMEIAFNELKPIIGNAGLGQKNNVINEGNIEILRIRNMKIA